MDSTTCSITGLGSATGPCSRALATAADAFGLRKTPPGVSMWLRRGAEGRTVAGSGAKGRGPRRRREKCWWRVQGNMRFFGQHEHSLDVKGRVILPARFRPAFEHGAFLTQYNNRCLALWPPDEFEQFFEKMAQQQESGSDDLNMARYMAATTTEVEVDKQGRFPIPFKMRQYARLENEVLVNGAIDRVELWSPVIWNEKVEPSEAALTEEQPTPT